MPLYAIMAEDGITPLRFGSHPVLPEGAVEIDGATTMAEAMLKVRIGGAWVTREPIAEPVTTQSILGYRMVFAGLPVGTRVMVQDVTAALAIINAVVNEGALDILLAVPGVYDVEIAPPAGRRWERRVTWS